VAKATNFASEIDADSEDVELKYYATPHTPYEVPQEKGNKEPGEGEGDGALVVVGEQTLPLGKRAKIRRRYVWNDAVSPMASHKCRRSASSRLGCDTQIHARR